MIRKKMILADEDEQYLTEIRYEFMERAPQLELITFTKKEKIYQYLEQGGEADILVVDERLAGEKLKVLSPSVIRIVLSSSMTVVDDFEIVKKYQRIETLLNDILLKYAQSSGTLEPICGDSNTRMVAFYSPSGGSGKTTLALAMASAGARLGLNTLYLNLEEIDSVKDLLPQTPGCLSDIFFAFDTKSMQTGIKANDKQAGIKIKESIGMEPTAGFNYVSGVESISQYHEIHSDVIKKLLEAVRELSSYELVILDQNSGFTEKTMRILEAADVIFMPVVEDEGSISKLQRLLGESSFHGGYDFLFSKMNLIMNKVGAAGNGLQHLPDSIRGRLPCCAVIPVSPVLARRSDILRAGDMLLQMMNPVIQAAMAEGGEVRR